MADDTVDPHPVVHVGVTDEQGIDLLAPAGALLVWFKLAPVRCGIHWLLVLILRLSNLQA